MLYIRNATKADLDLLFKWANDPIVRMNSFKTEPIPYENHVSWFNRIIADPSVLQYVLMEDDTPVGQIRLSIDGKEAEIGYSIANEFRGKGYGHIILQLVADEVKNYHPEIDKLVAKVKPNNTASNKLFKSEGYEMEYACYTKKLRSEME